MDREGGALLIFLTGTLLLLADGFYSGAADAELAHRVVLGAGQQRVVRLNDDV